MPKLVLILDLEVDDSQGGVPFLLKYVTALKKIARNRKFKYDGVESYLAKVTTDVRNFIGRVILLLMYLFVYDLFCLHE